MEHPVKEIKLLDGSAVLHAFGTPRGQRKASWEQQPVPAAAIMFELLIVNGIPYRGRIDLQFRSFPAGLNWWARDNYIRRAQLDTPATDKGRRAIIDAAELAVRLFASTVEGRAFFRSAEAYSYQDQIDRLHAEAASRRNEADQLEAQADELRKQLGAYLGHQLTLDPPSEASEAVPHV